MYGPSYGRPHALKAKAKAKAISSSEEEEVSECSTYDSEEIGRELAMLVRKFQKFPKRNRFGKSSKYDSKNTEASARDYDKRTCHKCKKTGITSLIAPSGKRAQRRKNLARMTILMTRRRSHQSPNQRRKPPPTEIALSLGRKWILRKLRNLRRNLTLGLQVWLS
mgnify:CR=1 FL=1